MCGKTNDRNDTIQQVITTNYNNYIKQKYEKPKIN